MCLGKQMSDWQATPVQLACCCWNGRFRFVLKGHSFIQQMRRVTLWFVMIGKCKKKKKEKQTNKKTTTSLVFSAQGKPRAHFAATMKIIQQGDPQGRQGGLIRKLLQWTCQDCCFTKLWGWQSTAVEQNHSLMKPAHLIWNSENHSYVLERFTPAGK